MRGYRRGVWLVCLVALLVATGCFSGGDERSRPERGVSFAGVDGVADVDTVSLLEGDSCPPPVAAFEIRVNGEASPLEVQFVDISTAEEGCEIRSWYWTFGDGTTSTERNPRHVYAAPGRYTVTLTVINDGGIGTATHDGAVLVRGRKPVVDLVPKTPGDVFSFAIAARRNGDR